MNTHHLKAFTAIVKYGGVIKAAAQMHLTQPALSASLKALEASLGATLLDRGRGNRPMKLTLEGERFHKRALAILAECELAREEARSGTAVKQRLRIGLLDTLPAGWAQQLLHALPAAVPGRAVEFWEGSAAQIAGWLEQERIEAAVTVIAEAAAHCKLLWREPFVVACSPRHPFANPQGKSLALRELAGAPFVFRAGCEMSPVGEAQLRASGIRLKTVVRATRDELAFDAVAQGHGFTLAPRSLVPGRLRAVKVSGLSLSRTVGVHWGQQLPKDMAKMLCKVAKTSPPDVHQRDIALRDPSSKTTSNSRSRPTRPRSS
jgi:DNA-binding transcriptional LysR family regulator